MAVVTANILAGLDYSPKSSQWLLPLLRLSAIILCKN
jgi:hypothetical protein